MPKYMLILSSSPKPREDLSPAELGQIFRKFGEWQEAIRAQGRYVSSEKLGDEGGKLVTSHGGRVSVTDGPYSEAKEVIGGYFTFRAADYDEALAIVRDCPFLAYGNIAVRQTDPMGCGGE